MTRTIDNKRNVHCALLAATLVLGCDAEPGSREIGEDPDGSRSNQSDERDPQSVLDACEQEPPPQVEDFYNGAGKRDITFAAFGDSQLAVGGSGCANNSANHNMGYVDLTLEALNGIDTQRWPTGAGFHRQNKHFRNIRGVLIAGDLTENGSEALPGTAGDCAEFTAFRERFGICGEAGLQYPVYEGYGNHDFPFSLDEDSEYHPVVGYVDRRNDYRPRLNHRLNPNAALGHYSWEWDDIHFINLNVSPSDKVKKLHRAQGTRRVDPHRALTYLNNNLANHSDGRQVVLMTHYGPANRGQERLPQSEQDALCAVLTNRDARVIAWIVGHTHKSDYYTWQCNGRDIPVFNVGSPHQSGSTGNESHFAMFRIGRNWLEAVDVSVEWDANYEVAYSVPGRSVLNDRANFNPDGQWGGWSVRVPIDQP